MPNSTEARQERVSRLAANPSIRPHGDPNTYINWGCHCTRCGTAYREYSKKLRAAKVLRDFDSAPPDDRRERLRAMGFAVNDPDEDVI